MQTYKQASSSKHKSKVVLQPEWQFWGHLTEFLVCVRTRAVTHTRDLTHLEKIGWVSAISNIMANIPPHAAAFSVQIFQVAHMLSAIMYRSTCYTVTIGWVSVISTTKPVLKCLATVYIFIALQQLAEQKFLKWLMLDLRETACMWGEGDDANLFSYDVKMKPKLQAVSAHRGVANCQWLRIKAA